MSSSATARPPGIVILGTPRSGTTLLRRLLDTHSRIACPPETYLLSAAARFLSEDEFAQGLRIGVLSGLGYAGFDEESVLARLRRFVFSFLDEYAEGRGKPRWAEKTAFDAFHIDAIRKLCDGHVRFVCLQRHGLDVACSLADLVERSGGYVRELHEYLRHYPQPLEALARAWVDTATRVAALAREDAHAMELRYESLVEDPEATLRRVLEFLDEPWEDGLVERALTGTGQVGFGDWKTYGRSTIDGASVDRWKALPRHTIVYLADICNPTLERLGYDPVPTSEADAEKAKRRYELGLLANRLRRDE